MEMSKTDREVSAPKHVNLGLSEHVHTILKAVD